MPTDTPHALNVDPDPGRASLEAWFATARPQQGALRALRRVLLDHDLGETLRWRQPCYQVDGRNLAILGTRKADCVLSLFQGVLLTDPEGLLLSAGPNTRAARLVRFTSAQDVHDREPALRRLIGEAIALERAGRRVDAAPASEPHPAELQACFDADPALQAAFEALTPGRQRGYLLHINAAKQASTRTARIMQAAPRIMAGLGRHDCHCGKSARMPRCDGSHSRA